jgi:hypothetical protein
MELSCGKAHVVKVPIANLLGEMPKMKKSTRCTALLATLALLSVGVNSIFIATAGGSTARQLQQVHHQASTPQQTVAVECRVEPKHCSPIVR